MKIMGKCNKTNKFPTKPSPNLMGEGAQAIAKCGRGHLYISIDLRVIISLIGTDKTFQLSP